MTGFNDAPSARYGLVVDGLTAHALITPFDQENRLEYIQRWVATESFPRVDCLQMISQTETNNGHTLDMWFNDEYNAMDIDALNPHATWLRDIYTSQDSELRDHVWRPGMIRGRVLILQSGVDGVSLGLTSPMILPIVGQILAFNNMLMHTIKAQP